jgi:hypothetical protein
VSPSAPAAPMRTRQPVARAAPAQQPLSVTDMAHARRDPGFAEYLRKQGYKF